MLATCSAGPPMLSRAITRTTLTRFGSGNAVDEAARDDSQPGLEIDARLPAQQVACAVDVRPGVADVAISLSVVLALDLLAQHGPDRVRELVDARPAAGRDVEDEPTHAAGVGGDQIRLDDVGDECEVALLLAVPVDGDRPLLADRGHEARDDGRILRRRVLVRTEDVEVTQRDRLDRIDPGEADAVPLGRELRDSIGRDRIGGL